MLSDPNIVAVRAMVRGAYDLQKLRIQTGLRLCANFRSKLADVAADIPADDAPVDPVDAAAEAEHEAKAEKLIDVLRDSYKRLTDGIARNRTLPTAEGFKGDPIITEFSELVLVHQYIALEREERQQFARIAEILLALPIHRDWLNNQIGIGPAMAGVLVTYFDITKAERPSQFWAFAGLDVGPGNLHRSRIREHLIEREYTDKNGEIKTRLSTTFDPWLQSKLLGALGPSLLRAGSPYRRHYDNYRHRIETDPARRKGTLKDKKIARAAGETGENIWHPLRIHRASMRYMVKQFVADFWRRWREIEGLPTVPPYHEGVLGHVHHEKPLRSARAAA